MKKTRQINIAAKASFYMLVLAWLLGTPIQAQDQPKEEYPYHLSQAPMGKGTSESPYQIGNIYNLLWIAEQVNTGTDMTGDLFIQTADIDMSPSHQWENGEGWMPIGGFFHVASIVKKFGFKGTYDGGGHRILNLKVNRPSFDYQGLFGYLNAGEIRNLVVEKADVTGKENVGALVAYIHDSQILNCRVIESKVRASDFYAGGLVGYQDKSLIRNCDVQAEVKAQDYLGGIVSWINEGEVRDCLMKGSVEGVAKDDKAARLAGGIASYILRGTIERCASHATVGSEEKVGGVVGSAVSAKILKCYSTAPSVKGRIYVGGLIGENDNSIIEDCYARTQVSGSQNIGGLLGSSSYSDSRVMRCYTVSSVVAEDETFAGAFIGIKSTGVVSACYWDKDASARDKAVGGFYHADIQCEGKGTAEMKTQATFTGWDFDKVWMIRDGVNDGYPTLRNAHNNALSITSCEELSVKLLRETSGYHIFSPSTIEQLRLYNLQGQQISVSYPRGNEYSLSTEELPEGNYVLQLRLSGVKETQYIKLQISR